MFERVICFLLLVTLSSASSFGQPDPTIDYRYKHRGTTGLRIGLHIPQVFFELGAGHILIDLPCNKLNKLTFGSVCNNPQKLQIDVSVEFKKDDRFSDKKVLQFLTGYKLNVSYTPLGWMKSDFKNVKLIYWTFGHIIAGVSVINYTTMLFDRNSVIIRPELGIMLPQRIKLRSREKLFMNLKIVYGQSRYINGNIMDIDKHWFSLYIFLF